MLALIGIVLLLAANAFFVAAEFALVKVRSVRLAQAIEDGSSAAKLTQRLLQRIEAYLAACQLGITMASLGLGWIGEPFVAALLEPLFLAAGLSDAALHTFSFVTGFLIFSALHIVVGEQVPKTLAIREPEPTAMWIAWPLHAFFLVIYPMNWALNAASRQILRWLGVAEAGHAEVVSSTELKSLIGLSRRHGSVPKHEHDMLGAILDLAEVEVSQIMTHRSKMATIDADMPHVEMLQFVRGSPFTRHPVWRGDPDQIIGILHAKDLLALVSDQGQLPAAHRIDPLLTPPWFIPDTTGLHQQLLAFRHRRQHLALVVDEYGTMMGLVTLEDIIEEIVGDIVDEKDVEISGIEPGSDGAALVDGRVAVRDVNRRFDWSLPDEEAATMAGLVMAVTRRIPEEGETVDIGSYRVAILKRQRHHLQRLQVSPIQEIPHDPDSH